MIKKKGYIPAIIIGRKGSSGLPGKNTINVLGKPLAYYPMAIAKNFSEIDDVFLSTDDEKLIKLAKELDIEIIERPAELATDEALGEDVFVHAYNYIKTNVTSRIELVVLLFCNSPTLNSKLLREGLAVLRENPEYDSAVSVSKYNMWSPLRARKIDNDGLLQPFIPFEYYKNIFGVSVEKLNCDRDSQGDVWFADMGVSIVRPKCLDNLEEGMLPQKWMGKKIYPLKQEAGLDVDYEWQIPQVEYWIKKYFDDGGKFEE